MALLTSVLLSIPFLLLLLHSSALYSLHNCDLDSDDLRRVTCDVLLWCSSLSSRPSPTTSKMAACLRLLPLQSVSLRRKKKKEGCADVYDAFVSYNVHDEEWVYHELVPELEERQGWKLCLHHRDFEPGKAILENIVDAIYSSRKTLCVISPQYLHSEWCSWEIQMASFRLFDEQKDEISSDQLSPFYRMRKLVKSRTYLSWTQARSHRGLFWERVRRALESGNNSIDINDPLTLNA
ncbi:hypothetical protein WMY93_009816 [Mugilogobius chulae]|uniref:TIR domain-containing protein n=1 Tax=Mugilogobius chulae TaxID=88201 RepID=A0AAW0P5A9_9GOBI